MYEENDWMLNTAASTQSSIFHVGGQQHHYDFISIPLKGESRENMYNS